MKLRFGRSFWVAVVAVALIAPLDLALFIISIPASAMECSGVGRCRPAEQVNEAYCFAVVSTVICLGAMTLLRPAVLRWSVAVITVVCAASPVAWMFTGHPR